MSLLDLDNFKKQIDDIYAEKVEQMMGGVT